VAQYNYLCHLKDIALTEEDIKNLMNNGLKFYAAVSSLDKLATAWGNLKR
jgi:hypothetical protein